MTRVRDESHSNSTAGHQTKPSCHCWFHFEKHTETSKNACHARYMPDVSRAMSSSPCPPEPVQRQNVAAVIQPLRQHVELPSNPQVLQALFGRTRVSVEVNILETSGNTDTLQFYKDYFYFPLRTQHGCQVCRPRFTWYREAHCTTVSHVLYPEESKWSEMILTQLML